MRRARVESSVIATIGYAAEESVLEVEFLSGRLYRYFLVPAAQHRALVEAKSIGTYFNLNIRDRYPCRELRAENGTTG